MILISIVALTAAQNVDPRPIVQTPKTYAELMAARIPVTDADITDHPYRIIAHVKRNVRKAFIFSKDPGSGKMEDELWERGKKVGADAVINARYGGARVTAMSWGASKVEGDAVHFLTGEEAAARGSSAPSVTSATQPLPAP